MQYSGQPHILKINKRNFPPFSHDVFFSSSSRRCWASFGQEYCNRLFSCKALRNCCCGCLLLFSRMLVSLTSTPEASTAAAATQDTTAPSATSAAAAAAKVVMTPSATPGAPTAPPRAAASPSPPRPATGAASETIRLNSPRRSPTTAARLAEAGILDQRPATLVHWPPALAAETDSSSNRRVLQADVHHSQNSNMSPSEDASAAASAARADDPLAASRADWQAAEPSPPTRFRIRPLLTSCSTARMPALMQVI